LIPTKLKAGFEAAGNESRPRAQAGRRACYQVICICGGYGFPFGPGATQRIINVGKALQKAGMEFRVLHCGPSPIAANKHVAGVHEGIAYEYTTHTTKRPANRILRDLLYMWGISVLIARLIALRSQRQRSSVYICIHSGPIGVIAAALCRILGIPVVQEVNEWWPGSGAPDESRFTNWLYRGPMFSLSTGVLVISTLIEERVRTTAQRLKRPLIIQRTPILADINKFHPGEPASARLKGDVPQFVWCGMFGVAGFSKDVDFMIRALARVLQKGMKCQLTIVAEAREDSRRRVMEYAQTQGVADAVVLTGLIDDDQLAALYRSAAGLLLPLYDDDRSRTRMPTKLASYLASGRPVVTCAVGDLSLLLSHQRSAYIGAPGDELAFAENMCAVLRDPVTARKIGAAGRRVCEAEIHYEVHATRLADFFAACIQSKQ
jgi:glycosyltransferase involved in cell wall biosynthesis